MDLFNEYLTHTEGKLIASAALIFILYILRLFVNKIHGNIKSSIRKRYLRQQITNYLVTVIGLVVIIILWYSSIKSVFTFLGLITGAIIISSKELILNLLANVVIFWRAVFQVGDRIQIGDIMGDVVEAGIVFITLSEIGNENNNGLATGSLIKVPNSMVLSKPVKNLTRGLPLIWNEIAVELTYTSNFKKARKILLEIAHSYSYKFSEDDLKDLKNYHEELMFVDKEPAVFTNLKSGKVLLTLHYICKFHNKRETENKIYEEVISRFSEEEDLEFKS